MCKLAHVIRYTVLSHNFHFCCFRAIAYIRMWNWVQFCLFNFISWRIYSGHYVRNFIRIGQVF